MYLAVLCLIFHLIIGIVVGKMYNKFTGFRALRRSIGCDAASVELEDSPLQDFLSGVGFAASTCTVNKGINMYSLVVVPSS